jgi:hypothetical protein
MTALELRDPLLLVILMEPYDAPLHHGSDPGFCPKLHTNVASVTAFHHLYVHAGDDLVG